MDSETYIDRLRQAMQNQYNETYIEKCCQYAKGLLDKDLPVLFDSRQVGLVLRLHEIRQDHYHEFSIPKSAGHRAIVAPSRPLKMRQQWIYKNILQKQSCSEFAHGFISGRSIVSNAALHIGYLYTLCIDIADFFPSIGIGDIISVFKDMGYSNSASEKLGELCSHAYALPQGAPTSPCLSNIICRKLDEELNDLARQSGAIYSRYADDITFSANHNISQMLPGIGRMLHKYGFLLNNDKYRIYGPSQPKHITGLVVQKEVHVPKAYKRRLRQEIYFCKKYGVTAHLENRKATNRVHFREHLYGKAYYIKMVEPEMGRYFLNELDTVAWPE